ncbi:MULTISPECIES: hypothetical protein [unclassified Caballeronia]|uniref:hypothetical protein n=1 Tax=unclassified Caballeronia TaxID=2646786 RepID=UPI00285EF54B|nr:MULTISPECIES: hypothetical protein [unclassified Caballeronia]MDR5754540.1 hypothetical protein [Caballeronia sp. LZ024]MDR5839511.1 hypothetical protein [Caballeronia sp. LZ031]
MSIAFAAVKAAAGSDQTIDRLVRREASRVFRKRSVIPSMIDRIKLMLRLGEDDGARGDSDA